MTPRWLHPSFLQSVLIFQMISSANMIQLFTLCHVLFDQLIASDDPEWHSAPSMNEKSDMIKIFINT